jgi:hypothetical protein
MAKTKQAAPKPPKKRDTETLDWEMESSDFSDFEIDLDDNFGSRYFKPAKTRERPETAIKYANAVKLAKDIELSRGCDYLVFVNGSFIFGDFIEALITEKNLHIKKMHICTLSLNENNVDSLALMINGGYVDELDLIVSDYFYSHERRNLIPYIYERLDKGSRFQLSACRVHLKMCIFETHSGEKIIMDGSVNLRSSNNIENVNVRESEGRYDFARDWFDKITEIYKTIDKSVNIGPAWEAM